MFPLSGNRKESNEFVSDGKVGVGVVPVSPISSVTCVVVVVVLISGLILGDSVEVADVVLLVLSVAEV